MNTLNAGAIKKIHPEKSNSFKKVKKNFLLFL